MPWGAAAIGLLVGFLIGLTGMGGGAMMTPLLLWTGWAAPTVAVGTDLVWNALTKIVGAAVHYRHRNVNLKLVWRLASGSVPGALVGLYLLGSLKKSAGLEFVDHLIVRLLGGTLILVAVGIIFKAYIHHWLPVTATRSATDENLKSWQVPAAWVRCRRAGFLDFGRKRQPHRNYSLAHVSRREVEPVGGQRCIPRSANCWCGRAGTLAPGRCELAAGIGSSAGICSRCLDGELYRQSHSGGGFAPRSGRSSIRDRIKIGIARNAASADIVSTRPVSATHIVEGTNQADIDPTTAETIAGTLR